MPPSLNAAALRVACRLLGFYFRHFPLRAGKLFVWDKFVRPYIAWRRFAITAKAEFGARFHGALPDAIHTYLLFFGVWEPVITAYIRSVLRPGDTVIDIGANVGAHTLLAAHLVGPTGQVHAIEASPSIFRRLQANLAANGVHNVTAYNFAASDHDGTVTVFLHDEWNAGGTTIMPGHAAEITAHAEAMVKARPVPDIVPREALRKARLVKIDVKGAEWLVLRGMREILPQMAPDVQFILEANAESLATFGMSIADLLAFFREYGFEAFEIDNAYGGAFYIDPPPLSLQPLTNTERSLMDIVLRRSDAAIRSR
jgi:FkbM family methyltransferase